MGLYVSNVDHALQKPLRDRAEAEPEGALRNGPGIFLCPERVLSWGDRHGIDPSLVLDKVYYHELAHAFMDTGPTPYDELWGRIVEESLANWLSYQRFSGKEARWVQRLIQDEPAEYQGYLAVGQWAGWWPSTEDGTDLIRAAHFWFRGSSLGWEEGVCPAGYTGSFGKPTRLSSAAGTAYLSGAFRYRLCSPFFRLTLRR